MCLTATMCVNSYTTQLFLSLSLTHSLPHKQAAHKVCVGPPATSPTCAWDSSRPRDEPRVLSDNSRDKEEPESELSAPSTRLALSKSSDETPWAKLDSRPVAFSLLASPISSGLPVNSAVEVAMFAATDAGVTSDWPNEDTCSSVDNNTNNSSITAT